MGSGKKQTIGHRYYVGLHLVMCRQADSLLQILMSSKRAWRGSLGGGRGTFNKPNLFGGDKREGGISGSFDFLKGGSTQGINDYLSSVLGALAPAYRGVVSVVMRRPYIGANTARLPNMKFKLMNVQGIHRGWYPEKAVFSTAQLTGDASVFIAWNLPGSTTPTQLAGMKEWLSGVVNSLSGTPTPLYIQVYGVETENAFGSGGIDYTGVIDWINSRTVPSDPGASSDWNIAFAQAPAFFAEGYDGGFVVPNWGAFRGPWRLGIQHYQ